MKQNLLKSALVILVCLTIASCRKSEMKPKSTAGMPPATGLYIINNNLADGSSLSFYNLKTRQLTPDQYHTVNGKSLGQTANDLEIYGSKMYITVTNSNVVDVVDAKTGRLIKQDSLLNSTYGPPWYSYGKQPRSMAFYKGNVYISCYDGTISVMDTINFSINTKITLSGLFYLEGMVVQNDKLYVADAGVGPSVTNKVSVIDLASNKEIKRISVVPYPVSLAADSYGNVYVLSGWTDDWQQFYVSTGGLTIIDSKTDSVTSPPVPGLYSAKNSIPITVDGDLVYYTAGDGKIAAFNAKTQTLVRDNFVTDGTPILYPYSICTNPVTGEVYIGDAQAGSANGYVSVFTKTGKLEYSFSLGVYPAKIKLLN